MSRVTIVLGISDDGLTHLLKYPGKTPVDVVATTFDRENCFFFTSTEEFLEKIKQIIEECQIKKQD